jgi:hypothetical protein
MKRGHQKRIPAFTSPNHSYHLMGAYHWAKDQVFIRSVERKYGQIFIRFLEFLLIEQFPAQKIILVMENASCHNSKTSMAAPSLFEPRVSVFWLSKYCPNLNPIERFWRHLKDLACANQLDLGIDNLAGRVDEVLSTQFSPDHVLKISFLQNIV